MGQEISVEELKDMFVYDEDLGFLGYNPDHYSAKKCERNIADNTGGVWINGKIYTVLRVVYAIKTGAFPTTTLHYKDGDKHNIEWSNVGQGHYQVSRAKSGISGIQECRSRGANWKVHFRVDGRNINGGTFLDLRDAVVELQSLRVQHGLPPAIIPPGAFDNGDGGMGDDDFLD